MPNYNPENTRESERLLSMAHLDALFYAAEHECASIAFPLVSSESSGYPREEALRVANIAIRDHLLFNDMKVYLVIPNKEDFAVSERLQGEVGSYIESYYVREGKARPREHLHYPMMVLTQAESMPSSFNDVIDRLDEPFSVTLLRLIDDRDMTDVDVIIEDFITRSRYDIFVINQILFQYDQPLLGG
ncbi:MAG: macro domain-containing protein [Firmicutes bacterium]|nr:macro domain-containing protein [Dethiobacter sp.]MBS3888497.1 macro domain-containing protein [Bacillota bacterium]MBS4055599.1 macro domain-containing protein [Thermaerobacter sp.]